MHPNTSIPRDIFSFVTSALRKKSSTNSGHHMRRFLVITINAMRINKTPIAVNQFLPRRRISGLIICMTNVVYTILIPGFLILFFIIALSKSGVDISAKYENSPGPK